MKKLILLGIVLVGQVALADTPQLKIARDELEVRRDNQRYAEAEYRRSKINYLTANKLLATSIKAVKYYEDAEELSRQAALTSEDSHVRIGATYVHEPRAAGTGIRMVGK
jgi:hypothetical protein